MELLEPPKGAHPCAGLTCAVLAPDIPALPHHPRVSGLIGNRRSVASFAVDNRVHCRE